MGNSLDDLGILFYSSKLHQYLLIRAMGHAIHAGT